MVPVMRTVILVPSCEAASSRSPSQGRSAARTTDPVLAAIRRDAHINLAPNLREVHASPFVFSLFVGHKPNFSLLSVSVISLRAAGSEKMSSEVSKRCTNDGQTVQHRKSFCSDAGANRDVQNISDNYVINN